jgi:hypothetical protein
MKDRRHFFKQLTAGTGLLGLSLLTGTVRGAELKVKLEQAMIHHVFFWLKNPNDPAACRLFEEGLKMLISIPEIKMSHVGKAVPSTREVVDDSFTYSYLAVFENRDDQDRYQTHPVHLKFIEQYGHLWEKVQVYDAES